MYLGFDNSGFLIYIVVTLFQTEVCSGSLPEIIQGVVAGADGCVFTYGYSKLGESFTKILICML